MYVLAGDKDELVVDLTAENAAIKLSSDASIAEIDEHLDEISSCRAQIAGYVTRIKQLEDQAADAMSEYTHRLSEADAKYRNLEPEKMTKNQTYREELIDSRGIDISYGKSNKDLELIILDDSEIFHKRKIGKRTDST